MTASAAARSTRNITRRRRGSAAAAGSPSPPLLHPHKTAGMSLPSPMKENRMQSGLCNMLWGCDVSWCCAMELSLCFATRVFLVCKKPSLAKPCLAKPCSAKPCSAKPCLARQVMWQFLPVGHPQLVHLVESPGSAACKSLDANLHDNSLSRTYLAHHELESIDIIIIIIMTTASITSSSAA